MNTGQRSTPSDSLYTDDYKEASYWLEDVLDFTVPNGVLPASADVVVIGSGYTGLHAAIQTAAAGRATIVIDSGDIGQGCSSRNGGQIDTSIKPSVQQLARKMGLGKAKAIRQEGINALNWIEDYVKDEAIDCHFERNGLYHAAHTPWHYEKMSREAEQLNREEGFEEAYSVPRSDQRTELGSDAYYGGVVFPKHAAIHAAKYRQGLVNKALNLGVSFVPYCPANSIIRHNQTGDGQFSVQTAKGAIKVRDVMIATNGYTTKLTPWFQRRVMPIGSYVIATEALPTELMDELFPSHRVASDSCKVIYYYRASPDRKRVLFGGRVSANETNPLVSGPRLHHQMSRIFPQLRDTRISHSWTGTVAYTFDEMPHTGVHNGLHYAMGFCGSGVSMSSYLGMRAGQKIIGNTDGVTPLDNLPFPTKPLYTGKPWFLPAAVALYAWKDKIEYTRAARQYP